MSPNHSLLYQYSISHIISLFLFTLCLIPATSFAGINFQNIQLEKALKKAKEEKKLVFIDTYAEWCAPCKVMDKVFKEEKVATFFNNNFINVKIDMDANQGSKMLHKYEVIWLPTLLVLNSEGEVISKIDRLVSAQELLEIASNSLKGRTFNNSSSLNQTPFSSSNSSSGPIDVDPESKEEILYVYDERASSGRPHIMYHEAYLHLQLMDGKHSSVVKKYLSTQDDWSSEKNIKFIFDFLQNVNQKTFSFFITNKSRFVEVIGKERVDNSLNIIINQRLFQGFPRPSLKEAIRLYSLIDQSQANENGYQYVLNYLRKEKRDLEFINTALEYLDFINPANHAIMYDVVSLRMLRTEHTQIIDQNIQLMKSAVSLHDSNSEYFFQLALLQYKKGDKEEALHTIDFALKFPNLAEAHHDKYLELHSKITAL